ncbi:MAG: DAK2 domain-containing protein [Anaerolineae bacterium]
MTAAERQTSIITGPRPASADGPILSINGAQWRDLLLAGLDWLDQHHEIVNALNVFPVPDGDTGTNMLMTMKSACREITDEHISSVSEVAKAVAHGALMGARGNSGVILSQILRGMSRSLGDQAILTGPALAAALSEGSRVAYKGVNRPVEGTILTVIKEAAAAAENAAQLEDDLRFILARVVHAANEAVANTPNLLPVLKQAGKVDSGGKGLFFILEGMYRALTGEQVAAPAPPVPAAPARAVKGHRQLPPLVYGFDVQFLVEGEHLDVAAIRDRITAMGDCPLVEGDENLVKVHVHVPDPGKVLSYAVSLGFVTDIVVENMDDMHIPEMPAGYDPLPPRFAAETTGTAAQPAAAEPQPLCNTEGTIEGPGIVAVVPGAGLAQIFLSLGTHCIVPGGQTMNPSTQDLLDAINRLPTAEVLLLPNNSNILMAAQQAQVLAGEHGKTVFVIPSKTIPQGISALLAYNSHADLQQNAETMASALENVQTGEVTVAVQDARFDGIEVRAGDVIGLLNDRLTATGPTPEAVVKTLLEQMRAGELEVITLYYGEPVAATQAQALQAELQELYPDQEIECVEGGQPYYHYIVSAE